MSWAFNTPAENNTLNAIAAICVSLFIFMRFIFALNVLICFFIPYNSLFTEAVPPLRYTMPGAGTAECPQYWIFHSTRQGVSGGISRLQYAAWRYRPARHCR